MPLSTTMIHYPASLIIISQVRQEAGTDRRKYFASCYYAKHSLHTTADDLSAYLSWTLNHFHGIHWSNFPMHYYVCLFLPSFNQLTFSQSFKVGQAAHSLSKPKCSGIHATPPCPVNGVLSIGRVFAVMYGIILFFFPHINSVTSPEERNSRNKGRPYECTNLLDNSSSVPLTNIY